MKQSGSVAIMGMTLKTRSSTLPPTPCLWSSGQITPMKIDSQDFRHFIQQKVMESVKHQYMTISLSHCMNPFIHLCLNALMHGCLSSSLFCCINVFLFYSVGSYLAISLHETNYIDGMILWRYTLT